MKSKLIILLTLFVSLIHAQDKFSFTKDGLDPKFLTENIDSLNQSQLYVKSINWIKNNYKNPDEVIESDIEDKMVRFSGIEKGTVKIGTVLFDIKYTIKISFKDGRYKFEPIEVQCKSQKNSIGWIDFSLSDGTPYFKNNGEAIKKFKPYTTDIPRLLNRINTSLINYINSNDDW